MRGVGGTSFGRCRASERARVGLLAVVSVGVLSIWAASAEAVTFTQQTLPFSGLSFPMGVTVDAAGDVFVVDQGNNRVLELAAGSSTPQTLPFTGLAGPKFVAVDATGDVFVTDAQNNRVASGQRYAADVAVQRASVSCGCDGRRGRRRVRRRFEQRACGGAAGGEQQPADAAVQRACVPNRGGGRRRRRRARR